MTDTEYSQSDERYKTLLAKVADHGSSSLYRMELEQLCLAEMERLTAANAIIEKLNKALFVRPGPEYIRRDTVLRYADQLSGGHDLASICVRHAINAYYDARELAEAAKEKKDD